MANSTDQGEPDAPEAVKWLKWIWNHLLGEAAVIWRAPGAFALSVIIVGALAYFVARREFAAEVRAKDASIETLNATIRFQDEKLATFQNRPSDGIEIGQAKILFRNIVRNDSSDGKFGLNIYLVNGGTIPAITPTSISDVIVRDGEMPQPLIDEHFKSLEVKAKANRVPDGTDERQPKESFFYTMYPPNLTIPEMDGEFRKRKKLLYFFTRIEYRDSSLPPNRWRVTEACKMQFFGNAVANCPSHNRIFLSD